MTALLGFNYGDPVRPFNNTFWGQRLPDNATVDTANGPAVIAEIVANSKLAKPNLNVWSWTIEPTIVPASQPLVPVYCTHDSTFDAIMKLGVPIPAGFKPTSDPDSAAAFYQPDYVDAKGYLGRYYELQALRQDPTSGAWSCNFGARMVGVNTATRGHFANWTASGQDPAGYASDPDSTYELQVWGAQGSGLPYMPGVLSLADVKRGYVDHALLLEVVDAAKGGHVWPAVARGDGGSATSVIMEGYRLRFPPGYPVPTGLHPLARLYVQGATTSGLVITDRTAYDLAVRAAPSIGAAGYLGSTADYDVLSGFPWQDLQLLAVGSDSNQTPTS